MAFCINCGQELTSSMRFCPSCGTRQDSSAALPGAAGAYAASDTLGSGAFMVILVSRGTCRAAETAELVEDILGYTAAQAKKIVQSAPVELACNLSLVQAQYIAQALTEYGMEISITNSSGEYMSADSGASSSVFDSHGNFLPAIAAALATLSVANRVRSIVRWRRPGPPPPLFSLGFRRPVPPPHMRRGYGHWGPVRPPSRRAHRPAPPPPPRKPPMGGPRPGGGHRPGGFGGPRGGGRGGGFRGGRWR